MPAERVTAKAPFRENGAWRENRRSTENFLARPREKLPLAAIPNMADNPRHCNRGVHNNDMNETLPKHASHTSVFCSLAMLLLVSQVALADIYTYVDEHGVRHLTNVPDDSRYKLVMRTNRPARSHASVRPQVPSRFKASIRQVAESVGLEPALISAVVKAESAFDPSARSHKGAVGLMQLMPGTAQRYGVANRRDPLQNLWGGARYLRDLLDEFRDLRLALAAYNAGEGAVRRYGNSVPPYAETQEYVRRVQRFYQHFRTSG